MRTQASQGRQAAVLIGAYTKFAFPRIAEYADGWIPVDQNDAMPAAVADLRAYMASKGRSFEELDHTVITHHLGMFEGNPDRLKQRIGELHAMGFNRVLLQLPSESADTQWRTLETLHKVAQAFT
ncbi:hypothetical protein WG907_16535 [Sphingobium sp. AN558]|uniref:hypothetical protein n=1 Tax=Sphingobium sp. AN558 TaxID=3133442 RepID=UPI0030BB336B